MARISGVNLSPKKHVEIALQSIYGIGSSSAKNICGKVGLKPFTKVMDLTEATRELIQKIISEEYTVEGDKRREVAMAIKRLTDVKCLRGLRHRRKLPVRGQRTRTNARTSKGKSGKGSVGSKKK